MQLVYRFWKSTKEYLPWLGIFGITLLGLLLLSASALVNWTIYGTGWEKVVSTAATAILGGGVAAIILKLLAIEGYFLEAVSKASLSSSALSKLNTEALTEHWHEVTARRFFPLIATGLSSNQQGWEDLRRDFQTAVAQRFNHIPTFYVKEYSRTLKFSWEDKTRRHLKLVDESRAVMVPFDAALPLSWTFTTFAELGKETNVVYDELLSCDLDDGTSVPTIVEGPDANGKKVTRFSPSIAKEYPINRERRIAWDISKEPIYTMLSPYIIKQAQVIIYNEADDLVIALQDLGTSNAPFEIKGKKKRLLSKGQMVTLFNNRVILPEQSLTLLTILQ